jgi:SAM-dependent methyltransferase
VWRINDVKYVPEFQTVEHDGITYAIGGDVANWIAIEERGAALLRAMAAAPCTSDELVARYANEHKLEAGKAWVHVHDFLAALGRAGWLADAPFAITRHSNGGPDIDTMRELGAEKRARKNLRSGYDAPLVLHATGDGASVATEEVREFYGAAAEAPVAELCCPAKYDDSAIAHIPQDVLDRFYGCGSPMTSANIKPGEIVVDLGSGAGIDVFIAAKFVGANGKAIGVDMTDRMLSVARENQPRVASALGYDCVEFREGFLEQIPVESKSADLITSNCVINLSSDKPRVFAEMWRVLKDHGRILISDIVAETPVPSHLKTNAQLWGECIVGALTQEEFVAELERAGFYGLEVLKKTYWKDVEGLPFFSVTVRGYKFEKTSGCVFKGHRAVYLGPAKAFVDEEGHMFPRNEPYEICTDTVAKLSNPPYAGMFAILEPGEERAGYACCGPEGCC